MNASRPELSLYDPERPPQPRVRIRCEPPSKPEPYFAIYAVQYVHGEPGTVMDGECIAKFPGHTPKQAEEAMDFAERLVRDQPRLATMHSVKNADALVVNNERGVEQARFPILRVVAKIEPRRTPWWMRLLGWKR